MRGVTFRNPAFPYTGRLYFPADERRDNCFMDQSLAIRITAPEAELSALSFCDPEPNSLADWVGSLPMAMGYIQAIIHPYFVARVGIV